MRGAGLYASYRVDGGDYAEGQGHSRGEEDSDGMGWTGGCDNGAGHHSHAEVGDGQGQFTNSHGIHGRIERRCQMAEHEQRDNSGVLFKNTTKSEGGSNANPKWPDYTGSIRVAGVDYRLAAWVKESQKGKFLTMSVTPKDGQWQAGQRAQQEDRGADLF